MERVTARKRLVGDKMENRDCLKVLTVSTHTCHHHEVGHLRSRYLESVGGGGGGGREVFP